MVLSTPANPAPEACAPTVLFLYALDGSPERVALSFARAFSTDDPVSLLMAVPDDTAAEALYERLVAAFEQAGLDMDQTPDMQLHPGVLDRSALETIGTQSAVALNEQLTDLTQGRLLVDWRPEAWRACLESHQREQAAQWQAAFDKDGYVVIPNVLTLEQVERLRQTIRSKLDLPPEERFPSYQDRILHDIFARHYEFRWLLAHRPVVTALRAVLGQDFVYLRENAATWEFFSDGWHKDTGQYDKGGETFHLSPDYRVVKAGFYLQDNSPLAGGGLDVERGSHGPLPDPCVSGLPYTVVEPHSILNRPTDMLIFHSRINHRATPRQQRLPETPDKVSIFIGCAANTPDVGAVHAFAAARYDYQRHYQYPPDLLAFAAARGISLP